MQSSASVRRLTLNWSCAAVSCKSVQSWMKRALVPCLLKFSSVALSYAPLSRLSPPSPAVARIRSSRESVDS